MVFLFLDYWSTEFLFLTWLQLIFFIFNWAKVWNFLLWLGWSTNLLFLAVTGLHTSREKVINIPNKFIKNRKNQGKSQKYSKSMMEL